MHGTITQRTQKRSIVGEQLGSRLSDTRALFFFLASSHWGNCGGMKLKEHKRHKGEGREEEGDNANSNTKKERKAA